MNRLGPPSASWERALGAVRAGVIAYVTVATFPHAYAYFSLHPGLDISWVYGLNQFAGDPWRFGRDVNFTFGPLGFLLFPANFGKHVLYAVLFRSAIAALFALCLALLSRSGRTLGFVLFGVGYGVALGMGHIFEFHLLILAALACLAALERRSLAGMVLTAALSGPLALTKFSLGPGAASVMLTGALAHVFLNRAPVRDAMGVILVHLTALLATAWLTMGSLHDVALWLHASLQLASGYSVAMTVDTGWSDHRLGIAICVVFLLTGAMLFRLRRSSALTPLLLGGTVFLAYKSGFVREDAHVLTFYGFAVAGMAAATIITASARERLVLVMGLIAVVAIAVEGETRRGYLQAPGFWDAATGRAGARGLFRALRPTAIRAELDRETAAALAPALLPKDMRATIGQASVMVMPTELVHCLANALRCIPPRTLQLYSAYTPYLDAITAEQLRGPSAPQFLLVHGLDTIDMRHVVLDDPATWHEVLAGYEPEPSARGGFALLRKRTAPSLGERKRVSTDALRFGAWLPVPPVPGRLLVEISFALTLRGRLTKFGHRIPPGYIQLKRASGAVEQRRLLFDMAGSGLLIHPFATELRDLPALFEARDVDRVVALRVLGPATRFYRDDAPVSWLAEAVPQAADGALGSAPSTSSE